MHVYVDTDVLLDVLLQRQPFFAASGQIWTLAETGAIDASASVLSIANLHYLLRRSIGSKAALKAIRTLRDIFTFVPLDLQIANQAMDADIADFEDAIQFFSALRAKTDALITRNVRDYPDDDIVVQTPAEFLAAHFPVT